MIEKFPSKEVQIPENLLRSFAEEKAKGAVPNLTENDWNALNEEHRRRMAGESREDLYYQLYTYRKMTAQGDNGVALKIKEIEEKLINENK